MSSLWQNRQQRDLGPGWAVGMAAGPRAWDCAVPTPVTQSNFYYSFLALRKSKPWIGVNQVINLAVCPSETLDIPLMIGNGIVRSTFIVPKKVSCFLLALLFNWAWSIFYSLVKGINMCSSNWFFKSNYLKKKQERFQLLWLLGCILHSQRFPLASSFWSLDNYSYQFFN